MIRQCLECRRVLTNCSTFSKTSLIRRKNLFTSSKSNNTRKEYAKKELIGYSMEQMYEVVSDVNNYSKFVPYCTKSKMYDVKEESARADVTVGFPPLNETYTSQLLLRSPKLVKAECYDGRLFNALLTIWAFDKGLKDVPNSSVVDFKLLFEFKNAIHSQLSSLFFDTIVKQMENAFTDEAKKRFGPPSIKTHIITTAMKETSSTSASSSSSSSTYT